MNITTTNFNYQQNYNNFAFKGNSRNLQKTLDKVLIKKNITQEDKNIVIEAIKKVLSTTLVPEKFMGKGTHKTVYKITHKYVARVPNNQNITKENIGNDLKIGESLFADLKNYFGEVIVKLGDFQILKNAGHHLPAGVPEHKLNKLPLSKINSYYLNKYLPKYAKISQVGYDELAKDMALLNNKKLGPRQFCVFDSLNPNNIVLSSGNLRFVDEIETLYDRSYGNTTAKLFEVLINRSTKSLDSPCSEKHIKFYRKIFKKIILATQKTDIVHADTQEDFKNWQKALQRCGIKASALQVINDLDMIQYQNKDIKERILNTKNYLNKLFIENKNS